MRYVIALGGNALEKIDDTSSLEKDLRGIALLYLKGNEVIVTHGNGPQVGELASVENESLAVLTAQTQAEIGVKLQRALLAAVSAASGSPVKKDIVSIVLTRATVDRESSEFMNPTKPIGRFYTKKEVGALSSKMPFKELIGGFRRVVPSPEPEEIMEIEVIDELVSSGHIVIACGGGGIPVSWDGGTAEFVDAVIDKDRSSALLAKGLRADRLIILTDVKGAFLDFKKKGKKLIEAADPDSMERYVGEGQFEEGSMLPKVEACISFVRDTGKTAVIGSLADFDSALKGKRCTVILKPKEE